MEISDGPSQSSQAGAGEVLPTWGTAFVSVKQSDRPVALDLSKRLCVLGFQIQATSGTAGYLREHGVQVWTVSQVKEGRPHIVDHIKNGAVALVINTRADRLRSRGFIIHSAGKPSTEVFQFSRP